MSLDVYSHCPGGTGKKIKFCCPDFLGELQKIDRMLEGEQHLACLQYIEHLERQHPDRPCLLATKIALLRMTGRSNEVAATVTHFLEKHPNNPIALAESAILQAVARNGRDAVGALQRLLNSSEGPIDRRVYEAIGAVAEILLNYGDWLAGRALLQLQMVMAEEDPHPVEMLVGINRSSQVPLLLKDDPPIATCPDDAPWKAQFEEAMAPTRKGDWQGAAEKLAALAEEVSDSPAIWRNLATLRGWLADRDGCIEALRKLAALDVPLEEAVEAEACAMLCSDDPLDDSMEMNNLRREIQDVERVQAAFSLDSRTLQIPFDPSSFSDEENPPPTSAYLLLDRPIPQSAEGITWESLSRVLGQAMIYGRQTDRAARMEIIGVAASDIERIGALLEEMVGDALGSETEKEVLAHVSASQELLQNKWRPPDDVTPEALQELAKEYRRNALLKRWPEVKLGTLDGKSPREAVQDKVYRVRVLAAILVLDCWLEQMPGGFDFDELRSELGLPTLGLIDPDETPVDDLPLVRLSRVMVEKLSDEVLADSFRRSVAFGVSAALKKFGQAVVDRPGLQGDEVQFQAYRYLSQTAEDPDAALQYIERGRAATLAANHSCAPWDLLELPLRLMRSEGDEISRLVQHVQQQHFEEPGVAEAMMRFLVQIGVIRPDGTPTEMPPEPDGSVVVGADQPPAEPEGIWTPDGQESGGGKKLWTPD